MREGSRITLYLRQQPEEQALYRYLMRRSRKERTTLLRNMILAEFRRRQTKERTLTQKQSSPRRPRATVRTPKAPCPQPTASASPWTQRVTL